MRTEILVLIVVVAVALVSMVVYHYGPEGRARGRDATGRGGSFVLGFFVRDWFYWFLRPVRWLAFVSGLPVIVFNLLGVALGVGAGVAFAFGHLPLGGLLIALSGVADVLDGDVARRRGLVSDAGAFLDSSLDRFAEVGLFAGLALFYDGGVALLLVVLGLGGSLLVSYTRARGESLGVLCKFGIMQRAERMLLLAAAGIFDPSVSAGFGRDTGALMFVVLAIVAVGTLGTAVYRTVWIARRLEAGS